MNRNGQNILDGVVAMRNGSEWLPGRHYAAFRPNRCRLVTVSCPRRLDTVEMLRRKQDSG
jgi:hypothetical protein